MERNRKIWMQILVLAAVLRFFPFDFQTAVSTASEDVAAECAGGEEQKPKIALTFDDGPNIKYTPMLLDGLKERGIKATFFLIGSNIDGNETVVKEMYENGHIVGNHTFHHVQLTKVSEEEAREEVVKTNNAIYEITGEYPVYIRPPFGEWREGLDLVVTMIPVLWDVDSRDWESQNTASICSEVLPNVKDGSIILMHDGYRATVEALRRILKELKEEGYTFVTVRELIEE